MKPFAAMLLPLVLVLGACSSDGGTPPVATVDGIEITQTELLDVVALVQGAEDPAASTPTVETQVTADVLSAMIQAKVAEQVLEDLGGTVTEEDRAATLAQLQQGSGLSPEAQEAVADLTAVFASLDRVLAEDDEVPEAPTDEEIQAFYDENPDQFAEVCARHILVGITEERTQQQALDEAAVIKDEIDAGGDFATIATERSEDEASAVEGGDLGCAPKGSYVEAFEETVWTAEVGVVTDPVLTEFGAHVILVESRETPAFEDVSEDIAAQLQGGSESELAAARSAELEELLGKAMIDAEVDVDPRYGTWELAMMDPTTGLPTPVDDPADATMAIVVPPGGPTTTTVPLGGVPSLEGELPAVAPAE